MTRDTVSLKVRAVLYFRVVEPNQVTEEIDNSLFVICQRAQAILHSVCGQVCSLRHRPVKCGVRFSMNARGPSRASADRITSRALSSSMAKASSSGRPLPRMTVSLILRTASGPFAAMMRATAKARSNSRSRGTISFLEPQRAITPGQAAVFYRQEEVIGGGWINAVLS